MKKTALALTTLLLLPALATAQPVPAWDATLRSFDSVYWDAYNRCDIPALTRMNIDDFEFYHDTGGPLLGNARFAQAMQANICGTPGRTIRRVEVAGSVHVFPMRANEQLYGAVIEGEHQFYRRSAGQPEQLEGRARFTHLVLLQAGVWKMARVLSYDHGPAPTGGAVTEMTLTTAQLDRHGGTYSGAGHPPFIVQRAGDHLTLATEGKTFALVASGPDTFFLRGRDITATFEHAQGASSTVTIREAGAVVGVGTRAE